MLDDVVFAGRLYPPSIPESGENGDGVVDYARVFCHHASLALEYIDAVELGAGHCIPRYWRILLLYFHSIGHTKYAWRLYAFSLNW
jgi:hypothetical protein